MKKRISKQDLLEAISRFGRSDLVQGKTRKKSASGPRKNSELLESYEHRRVTSDGLFDGFDKVIDGLSADGFSRVCLLESEGKEIIVFLNDESREVYGILTDSGSAKE